MDHKEWGTNKDYFLEHWFRKQKSESSVCEEGQCRKNELWKKEKEVVLHLFRAQTGPVENGRVDELKRHNRITEGYWKIFWSWSSWIYINIVHWRETCSINPQLLLSRHEPNWWLGLKPTTFMTWTHVLELEPSLNPDWDLNPAKTQIESWTHVCVFVLFLSF